MIEYQFPDRLLEADYIRHLPATEIYKYRDEVRERLNSLLRVAEDAAQGMQEHCCEICVEYGYGYKDLPDDWAYIDDITLPMGLVLLCDGCLGNWYVRFGSLPPLCRTIEL